MDKNGQNIDGEFFLWIKMGKTLMESSFHGKMSKTLMESSFYG